MPIFSRNFTELELLTPGTQRLGWQHASSENPQGSLQIMVNGQHFSGTSFQLDGTDNRDPILGIIVINPNLDGVTQAKITSQNYDAEFGQAVAIARGTPQNPLVNPEDLLDAKIVDATPQAKRPGITIGMPGREAVELLLAASQT